MKTFSSLVFALLLTVGMSVGAFAQSDSEAARNSPPQPSNNPRSTDGAGSPPPEKATTGLASPAQPYVPSDSSDKQPPVATGSDLRGPPEAFPSNKAPE